MKHLVIIIVLLFSCVFIGRANASSIDDFDDAIGVAFEAFDQNTEAKFAEIDKAVAKAFSEIDELIEPVWGGQTKLPESKVWVGYEKNLDARVVIDYEKGNVSIETVNKQRSNKELLEIMDKMLEASSKELDSRDILADRIKKNIKSAQTGAVILKAPKTHEKRELFNLIDRAKKPVFSIKRTTTKQNKTITVQSVTLPFVPNHEKLSAEKVKKPVNTFADRYKLPRSLVLAIIKNESSFNPRAQSHIPAFGLMQLVPRTGGRDAYKFVKGKDKPPTPSYLFRVNENIELGSAYLHIVNSRYLRQIKNPQSRLYCTIAAYNTGAGNVAKAFGSRTHIKGAASKINSMTPAQVYKHLVINLPYEETRKYLPKVTRDMKKFTYLNKV
ncbi:MAG: DUF3393 domain-containing protein [Alphaproteobacteria bacterium]|nr:DUF3393 domain-containing protein [Alphaproteobacteria bacterium]